ncbi:unnamed protein product [Caenorhabditis brenneri]
MSWDEINHERCTAYVDAGKPQKTAADKLNYKGCCENAYYCEVWVQAWFWYMIGGIILLLIIICALGCIYCCCLRNRMCCGNDLINVEEQKKDSESSEGSKDSN